MELPFGRIICIGAGKMGGALVDGWLCRGVAPNRLTLVDPALRAGASWIGRGVRALGTADDLQPQEADLLVLAVKPQLMDGVLASLVHLDHGGLTVLSIAAVISLASLDQAFPKAACVRSMPNTPASVGAGITACFGPALGERRAEGISALLEAVGTVIWLEHESQMDAVTALSGSGPAYVFHMVEALAQAGQALGLSGEAAMALARQTVVGAGALLAASPDSTEQLRVNVTSPGGTTAAGLAVLRDSGALAALMEATLRAAHDRSRALGASSAPPKT
jgi:pyrroline-5-carboxylate reductase